MYIRVKMSNTIKKRICQGKSSWTGKPCEAKAVGPNTLRRGTREFLNPNYCQMHQPDKVSRKKCVCPMCDYHRNKKVDDVKTNLVETYEQNEEDEAGENLFGRRKYKKKKPSKS